MSDTDLHAFFERYIDVLNALHKVRDGRIHEMNFLLDVDAVRTQLGV